MFKIKKLVLRRLQIILKVLFEVIQTLIDFSLFYNSSDNIWYSPINVGARTDNSVLTPSFTTVLNKFKKLAKLFIMA